MDRISNLPEEVKAKILSYLPIKEAIKTSNLSSKWRYTWSSISELEIREEYFSSLKLRENRSRLVKFIDILFLLHQGPICNFKLSTKQCHRDALSRWIVNLSRNEIQKIHFELNIRKKYKLPINFYSLEGLNSLNLSNCYIRLPQEFKGFNLLITLRLEDCSFSALHIEKLISNCPNLENLSLIKFRKKINLKINAPKLETLSIEGIFTDLQLNTPKVIKACIDLETLHIGRTKNSSKSNFFKVFGDLRDLKMLGIHRHCLPYLAQGFTIDKIAPNLESLKDMVVDINLEDSKEVETALFLFQNARNLHNLDINVSGTTVDRIASITIPNAVTIHQLKEVNIKSHAYSTAVVEFARFILATSPILEKLCVSTDLMDTTYNEIFNEILNFPRASRRIMFGQNIQGLHQNFVQIVLSSNL